MEMKALTLWPEWCWPIIHLDKRVENRSRRPPQSAIGRRFAIHAGQNIGGKKRLRIIPAIKQMVLTAQAADWEYKPDTEHTGYHLGIFVNPANRIERFCPHDIILGAIVATALLERVDYMCPTAPEAMLPPWGARDSWHWHLADVQVLYNPVHCRGRQGLWTLPTELTHTVLGSRVRSAA